MSEFTHMRPGEIKIWEQFFVETKIKFLSFDYDVHVGLGAPINPDWPEPVKKMMTALTVHRIDAVGHTADRIRIIEVKDDLGLTGLGQLLGYRFLYLQDAARKKLVITKPISLMAVYVSPESDMIPLYEHFKIELHQVKMPK